MSGSPGPDKTETRRLHGATGAATLSAPEPGAQVRRLVVYADYVCPFCYLAEVGVARLRRDGLVSVDGAAFELRPSGTPLPAADAEWMRNAWTRHVEPLARELGVDMRYPAVMTRTRKAHEAAAYARAEGRWEAMHAALYRAYWVEGRDIGRIDVLSAIGGEVGLDPISVRIALDVDQWSERVAGEEHAASALELRAVPAYILTDGDEDGAVAASAVRTGLMRYEELRSWVETET
jgi:predicted DsbA family dithiol-disulfide isomerase